MSEIVSQQTRFYPTQNATQQSYFEDWFNDEKKIYKTRKEIAQVVVSLIKFLMSFLFTHKCHFLLSGCGIWKPKKYNTLVYDKKIETTALPNVFHSNFDLHYYEKK